MKKLLLTLLLPLMFVSCAHEIKRAVIVPSLEVVSHTVKRSELINNKTSSVINDQSKAITLQKLDIEQSIIQAESIKDKVASNSVITPVEAKTLVDLLQNVKSRNLFLEQHNIELKTLNNDQSINLQTLNGDLKEAIDKAILKEKETDELRQALEKEKRISASAKVYRNWIWCIVGGFILWTIIKNLLLIYFPAIRFRV